MSNSPRYALTSSLYGPGPIVSWHLTLLAVIIRWTARPKCRKSDSINADFMTVLILPTIAAADLCLQNRNLQIFMSDASNTNASPSLAQKIAAMEASLMVVEMGSVMAKILFSIAIYHACFIRVVILSAFEVLFFAALCHVCPSQIGSGSLKFQPDTFELESSTFSRVYGGDVTGFSTVLIAVIVVKQMVLVVSAILTTESGIPLLGLTYHRAQTGDDNQARNCNTDHSHPSNRSTNQTTEKREKPADIRKKIKLLFSVLVYILQYTTFIWALVQINRQSIDAKSSSQTIYFKSRVAASQIGERYLPKTNYSITELDQAVAATAGGLVLTSTIISTVKAHILAGRTGPES